MSDLVSLGDMQAYLGDGLPAGDNPLITAMLEHVEDLFERECGRQKAPFKASHARTDTLRGTGTPKLWLEYPVGTGSTPITAVKLGRDPANPDETLDPADPTVVLYEAGDRLIERVDGGVWGALDVRGWNRITYTTADDLPEAAKFAVKRVVAAAYQQRGSEDVFSESDSGFFHQIAKLVESNPEWERAVAALRRTAFV